MNLSLPDSAWRQMETNFTHKLAAYRLFSQAITNWPNTQDGLDRGIRVLGQAITADPNHAQAYAELAFYYQEASGFYLPMAQAREQARVHALRALQLDDSLARAHRALALVCSRQDLNLPEAEAHFQRAIDLSPSDGAAYGECGMELSLFGRFVEADEVLTRGERVNARDHNLLCGWCWRYYLGRDFDKAVEAATRLRAAHPGSVMGPWFAALASEGLHDYSQALKWAEKARQIDSSPDMISHLGRLHGRLGNRDKAQRALEDLRVMPRSPGFTQLASAEILLALGETNRTLDHLERALEDYPPSVLFLRAFPTWDDLRSTPRFQTLVQKMGR